MLKIYNKSFKSNHLLEINYEVFRFPAGEVHFRMQDQLVVGDAIHIKTDLHNSDEIMLLALLADYFKVPTHLELLYVPYARQDRKTSNDEPFSLKTFAKMINAMGFTSVALWDCHSDVTPALIENCIVRSRLEAIHNTIPNVMFNNSIIISPDAGAIKANNKVADHYQVPHVIAAKIRNITTGEISHTEVNTSADLRGRHLIILDDICDGGATFIALAKVLRAHHPKLLSLYVTVGIFSRGIEVLQEHFDNIYYHHKLGA